MANKGMGELFDDLSPHHPPEIGTSVDEPTLLFGVITHCHAGRTPHRNPAVSPMRPHRGSEHLERVNNPPLTVLRFRLVP